MEFSKQQEEVWAIVSSLNKAWTKEGNVDALKKYFHKEMVAITPSDMLRLDGSDACISSWNAFAASAKVLKWREREPKVQLYGEGRFAVVTYYFDIAFVMQGQTTTTSGRDMFVLVNEGGQWRIVADHFSACPAD